MHWFAALRPCFTAPKPYFAVFCKKRDPITPVQSKHAFAPSIFPFCFRKCVFVTAPQPFFQAPEPAPPNFPQNAIRSCLCGPSTIRPIPFWSVFYAFFTEMHWFAAPRLCFTAPKPCLAYFYKKSDPLTPVRSKYTFAHPIF